MQLLQNRLVIKVLKSKLFFWSTVPVFVLGIIILAYFLSIKDFPVFPNNRTFEYRTYSDSAAGGNSRIIRKVVTDSIIKLEFQISNKINTPYAGLNVAPKESNTINLENYNQLTIRLNGTEINGIAIALITENHLKKSDKESQGYLFYHFFKISPGINTYQIRLDKFKLPDWWRETNRIEDSSTLRPELKYLKGINVSVAITPNTGKIQSFEIYSLVFSSNNNLLIIATIALEFLFILFVFTVLYVLENMREKKHTITITYKAIENTTIDSKKSDFIEFINHNFQNSELTLDLVSFETGISQRRITNEIQNQFGCNFKTYINRLRINESKRLLLEKDLNIGEIAFRVGFNNQTHFNRVFKSEVQISPTEYRDKHKV
jgi:AraC-like DNA-binding protein